MTREEAIETIKDICLTTEQLTRIEKALECLLSEPSLPSNIDEAANEEADRLFADMKIDDDMIYITTAKALMIALARFGAEWMARQGKSIVAKIGLATKKVRCTISEKTLDSLGVGADDEIILQIRKKQ